MKNENAFLGNGWEDVRLKIPKGKYRLVMLDFWDHTATVIDDFDTPEEAREFMDEMGIIEDAESYTEFVIYNDQGEVVEQITSEGSDKKGIPVFDDVEIVIKEDMNYTAVAIFVDEQGEFEDLVFEETKTLEDAKNMAKNFKDRYPDADRIIILNRNGEILWEQK